MTFCRTEAHVQSSGSDRERNRRHARVPRGAHKTPGQGRHEGRGRRHHDCEPIRILYASPSSTSDLRTDVRMFGSMDVWMHILQDSEQYVEKLLELFNRFSLLVKEAFNDDPRFLTSRDKVLSSLFMIKQFK